MHQEDPPSSRPSSPGVRPGFSPLSGASLGLDALGESPDVPPSAPEPFRQPPETRYTEGGVLGRGGMGEIRAVYDERLGRLVALKLPSSPDPRTAQRLVEEATITARLEHPGIIAVHDAGHTADGRPFYTMPIVRGQTLGEAALGLPVEQRLRLVRHFLDACEAVAYAHSQGTLHRDLKPANILVGRFGETAVVDWGLAGPIGQPASAHQVAVGTPGYMPPEQARGEPLQASADVYALGVTLRELLTGMAPGAGAAPVPSLPSSNQPPPVPLDSLPRDLLAVVERATQLKPSDRYPDARALADDVSAWFEGRQVTAHRYSRRELAIRAFVAYRTPLLVAALALIGIAGVSLLGYWRTSVAHELAIVAERAAVEARATSDRHLAMAEVAQALEAVARDEWAEAEILAASALTYGESPEARGALARFDSRTRPKRLRREPLPDCDSLAVSSHGERVACGVGDTLSILTPDAPGQPPTRITAKTTQLAFSGPGQSLLVDLNGVGMVTYRTEPNSPYRFLESESTLQMFSASHGETGCWLAGNMEHWADLKAGTVQLTRVCYDLSGTIPLLVGVGAGGQRLAVCQNGQGFGFDARTGEPRPLFRVPLDGSVPYVLNFSESDGQRVAIATTLGRVSIYDMTSGALVRTLLTGINTPSDMALSDTMLAISDGRDSVHVWNIDSTTRVARFTAKAALVRWANRPGTLRLIGQAVEDWQLPPVAPWPHLHRTGWGISALAVAPDGEQIVTAHGNGHIRLHRLAQPEALWDIPLHWSVVKDVVFSPDSRTVVAVCAQDPNLYVVEVEDPAGLRLIPAQSGRRLVWLKHFLLLLAPYKGGLLAWQGTPNGRPVHYLGAADIPEMETDADLTAVTARIASGQVVRLHESDPSRLEEVAPSGNSTAVAGSVTGVALLERSGLEVHLKSGAIRRVRFGRSLATDVAYSPAGDWIAVGHQDGTVSLWSAERLERRAVFQGHTGRVSNLAFDRTGDWLISGSWDGDVRTWSMRSLTVPAQTLLQEATAAWGKTVEEVLYSRTLR